MYKAQAEQGGAANDEKAEEQSSESNDEDVQDVDFEEVK
jgi:hypothetical protein